MSRDGLVNKGGHVVFRCECGREQGYAPRGRSGGVSIKEAELLGWKRKAEGSAGESSVTWECPFCSGAATADHPAWESEDLRTESGHELGGHQ